MIRRSIDDASAEEWDQVSKNNGGSTNYYDVPNDALTLDDLIEHKNMNFAIGNIFKACYRYGEKDSASKLYDLNKMIYYAQREINRLQ